MSPALASGAPLPTLLPIAELMWRELTAFGLLAPADLALSLLAEADRADGERAREGIERYLVTRQVMAEVVLGTLEAEAGLQLVERAAFRSGLGDWLPGTPLAGYTGPGGHVTPARAACSLLGNWRPDLGSDVAATGEAHRVLRSMLWVAAHESVSAATHYGFDLLEQGRVMSSKAVAEATSLLLAARSHTASDGEAVSRLRASRGTDSRRDWLDLRPALDWFAITHLSDEMRALEMELVERVLLAVERVRAAESLDAFVLGWCATDKLSRALSLLLRWTNDTVPLSLRALDSQLEEISADHNVMIIGLEIGSFTMLVQQAQSLANEYRAIVGAGWEARLRAERLMLPPACADLDAEAVPPDWVLPSWRIAQPWLAWHSLDVDPTTRRNVFHDGHRIRGELLDDTPPPARRAHIDEVLGAVHEARRAGAAAKAQTLIEDLLRLYPWADPVWSTAALVRRECGDIAEAISGIGAALVLRPCDPAFWQSLAVILGETGSDEEARIASLVSKPMSRLMEAGSIDRLVAGRSPAREPPRRRWRR